MNTERTIHAYAAMKREIKVEPWTYVARPLGPEDVEIEISCCGICGSDLHTIDGWGGAIYPLVVGHEIIGKVTQCGAQVSHLQVGDRVGVGAQAYACLSKDPKECEECPKGRDPHCLKAVYTYNGTYEDGHHSYGGYADYVRLSSHYAFKIPENIPSELAAPLLCAGATVFTPLKRHDIKQGDIIGVVGIGGLGHLGLQFAKALGATVVAISHSPSKELEAKGFGADEFINMQDPMSIDQFKGKLTHVLMTADGTNLPYDTYLSMLKRHGKFIVVGLPNDQMKVSLFGIVVNDVSIHGSLVGSIQDIKDMLQVASKHNVRPKIQTLPMAKANEGLQMVQQGKARYRIVLQNQSTI